MRVLAMLVMVALPHNGAWLAVSSIVSPAHDHVAGEQVALVDTGTGFMASIPLDEFSAQGLCQSPAAPSRAQLRSQPDGLICSCRRPARA
jgi:hypothetical protein